MIDGYMQNDAGVILTIGRSSGLATARTGGGPSRTGSCRPGRTSELVFHASELSI